MSTIDANESFWALGTQVFPHEVPALVEAGRTVFAAGYGDDPEGFDALTTDDLWAFKDARVNGDASVVESWAPFVVADEVGYTEREHILDHMVESMPGCAFCEAIRG